MKMDKFRVLNMIFLMMFTGWLMVWILLPTKSYKLKWTPKLQSHLNSIYFREQGTNILLFSFPIMFIAALSCVYLHLHKKSPNSNRWQAKFRSVSLRLGYIGNICWAFLFFPVTRGSSLLPLVGLTSESSIKYHIWLGHLSTVLFAAHTALEWSQTYVSNVAGEIAMVVALIMWVASFNRVRRKMFEVFFYTHQLYTIYIIFYVLHVGAAYFCMILPGIFLFLIDRYLRFLQSRDRVRLLSSRILPGGNFEMTFAKTPGLQYNPTSILFINVPSISKLQWHPFTISSNSNIEIDKLSIMVRTEGSWSQKLYKQLSSSVNHLDVSVEGPYGPSSFSFLRHEALIMVSGGSGITPFISIIREIMFQSTIPNSHVPRVVLVCAFKTSADLAMLDLLLPISGSHAEQISQIELQIEAYVTQENEQPIIEAQKTIQTTFFKPNPMDRPISSTFGPNSWLWLGAIISSSFVLFLLVLGLVTRYYIYPVDNSGGFYHYSYRCLWDMFLVCACICLASSVAFVWSKSCNVGLIDTKQIQNVEMGTPTSSPAAWSYVGGDYREVESLPNQSLAQAIKVHFGARPDLKKILFESKAFDVGVLVCGPRKMRHEVAKICASGFSLRYLRKLVKEEIKARVALSDTIDNVESSRYIGHPTRFLSRLVFFVGLLMESPLQGIRLVVVWPRGEVQWHAKLRSVSLRLAYMGNICWAFLFFPVTRSSSLLPLVGLTSESSIKYHIWLGHLSTVLFAGHTLGVLTSWITTNQMFKALEWSKVHVSNVAGEIAIVVALVMWMASVSRVRRKMFEVFFYTHQLYTVYIIFYVLHVGAAYFCMILPGIFLFLIDRYLRFLQSRDKVRLLSSRILPGGNFEMTFAKTPGLQYNPTSILFVNVPSISKLQWHPFTISSNSNMDSDKLSVMVRVEGSWTKKLHKKVCSPVHNKHLDVSVEGPYGPSSFSFLSHEALIMVSGGSGITPFISIIREIMYQSTIPNSHVPRVVLVCAFKTSADLAMLDLLLSIAGSHAQQITEIQLKIEAYVTQESRQTTENQNIIRTSFFKPNPTDKPISATLGPNSWLWLGAIISSSFVLFLLLLGLVTRYYIYPVDNSGGYYHYSYRCLWVMFLVCACVYLASSVAFVLSKSFNGNNSKKIQHVDMETSTLSPPAWCYVGDDYREVESLPVQSLVQAINVHFGVRPDLKKILFESKASDVGVLVCGPRKMRHEVAKICASGLADNLHFESISFN
ncbi:hypothetical protein F8388_026977 [Cannabis sativa]|uniref:ferric-chelate reductase (NADH) n=1 Tax=Cannabis sativa TaxID=3483 RepID=A0A7J6EDH4_CANSA|nr:hypothetical protein F8388_026977 [Cannabis sativa]